MIRRFLDGIPVTALGVLALAAGVAMRQYGRHRQDLILYVAGYGVLGIGVVTALLVIGTALILRLSWRPKLREGERVDAGAKVVTGFSLPSLGWLPFVSMRWQWIEPEQVIVRSVARRGRLVEEVIHGERGEHLRTVRRVVIEDVFGLNRIGLRLVEPSAWTVLPARGRPPTAPLLQALAGGDQVSHPHGPPDGDLVEMRRYAPGDPIKRVLWKTFARTRALMVRLPERAVSPTRRTLAFLVAGDGDEAPAALARMALESDALGPEWRFGADGSTDDARRLPEALSLIVRSRSARAEGGHGLAGFFARATDFGAGRCVIFAPATPGSWLSTVAAEVKRRPGRVEVVVGTDGIADPARHRGLRRWLIAPEPEPAGVTRSVDLDSVTRALAAAGATVTVIDRPSGRVLGRGARRRAA